MIACLALTAGCTEKTKPEPEIKESFRGVTDDRIKIGTYGPLSGPAAAWGVMFKGLEAYFEHINASGGIHGRKLELVVRDDQYNPAKTPGVVRELVEKEGVFAIALGIGTANGMSVSEYLEKKGVPFYTPASGARFWTDPGPTNVYTVYPRTFTEGKILGHHIAKTVGDGAVAVLHQDDDFGNEGALGLEAGLSRFGKKIHTKVTCLPTDTDMSGQVSRILAAEPAALAIFAGPKQAVMVVKALHAQKKKPQIFTSFVLSDAIMFELAGSAWDGTITSATKKLPSSDDPAVKRYKEILENYGDGAPVGSFTMSGVGYAIPLVEALERAGRQLTDESLYKALQSLSDFEGGGPHFGETGLIGKVSFDTGRLGTDQIFLAKGVDGHWEQMTDWIGPSP